MMSQKAWITQILPEDVEMLRSHCNSLMEKNWRAQLELEEVVVPVPYWYQWWLDHFKLEGLLGQIPIL